MGVEYARFLRPGRVAVAVEGPWADSRRGACIDSTLLAFSVRFDMDDELWAARPPPVAGMAT